MKDRVFVEVRSNIEPLDEGNHSAVGAGRFALYVDRETRQWVVRDPDGRYWRLPSDDNSWEHREHFPLTVKSELEIVPGHYRYMLDLPF